MFLAGLPKIFFSAGGSCVRALPADAIQRSKYLGEDQGELQHVQKTDGINNPLMVCFLLVFPHYIPSGKLT